MQRHSMHPPQLIFTTRAIRLRSKRDVKTCMHLSPPMNSKRLFGRARKERDTRERASSPGAFHVPSPNLSRDVPVAGSFHRYPTRLRSFRMQLSILRYEQTTLHNLRDCVHTVTANFSTRGDALRIIQRSYRACVHLSAFDRLSCQQYNHSV